MEPTNSTLLAAVWASGGDEDAVRGQLTNGELLLTGNFKGRESEVAEVN